MLTRTKAFGRLLYSLWWDFFVSLLSQQESPVRTETVARQQNHQLLFCCACAKCEFQLAQLSNINRPHNKRHSHAYKISTNGVPYTIRSQRSHKAHALELYGDSSLWHHILTTRCALEKALHERYLRKELFCECICKNSFCLHNIHRARNFFFIIATLHILLSFSVTVSLFIAEPF